MHTAEPATSVTCFGKTGVEGGAGTVHSQELAIVPPLCRGMKQSWQTLVPEEKYETW